MGGLAGSALLQFIQDSCFDPQANDIVHGVAFLRVLRPWFPIQVTRVRRRKERTALHLKAQLGYEPTPSTESGWNLLAGKADGQDQYLRPSPDAPHNRIESKPAIETVDAVESPCQPHEGP